jgi:hypothetical protein
MKSMQRTFICERNAGFNVSANILADGFRKRRMPWWAKLPGWIQQNKASIPKGSDKFVEVIASHSSPQFSANLAQIKNTPKNSGWNPYNQLAHMIQENVGRIINDMVPDTNHLTLALAACALERYWLAHSNYPDTLAELVPTYLDKVPLDIIDGQPLRYRRTENGRFTLYSIGLDGKDDGGKSVDPKASDSPGDWAWPQPIDPTVN